MGNWGLSRVIGLVAVATAVVICAPSLALAQDKTTKPTSGSIYLLNKTPINFSPVSLSSTNSPAPDADAIVLSHGLIMPSQTFTMRELPDAEAHELDARSPLIAPLRIAGEEAPSHPINIQDPNLGIKAVDQQLSMMGPRQANTFPVMAALTMLGAALKVTGTSGVTVNLGQQSH